MEENTSVADDVFLAQHGEMQGIFFFVVEGADSFGYVRE